MLQHPTLFKLSCASVLVAVVVVVLGAFTRLVDAGLGCPDWPTCYGHLWIPNEAHEIEAANKAFEDTPVETDKTWPEQIHRIFASSLGLFILAIFFFALRSKEVTGVRSVVVLLGVLVLGTVARIVFGDVLDPVLWIMVIAYFGNLIRISKRDTGLPSVSDVPFKLIAILAGLVILQGLFGMWTVTLKLWPQVVTGHLLGGFATLSLLWLLVQRSAGWCWSLSAENRERLLSLKGLAMLSLIVVFVQIALGGWTSSNYAALACPDFPLCQNALLPPTDFAQGFNLFQKLGPNYLGGLMDNHARVSIHLSHRVGAIVTTIVLLILAIKMWRIDDKQVNRMAWIMVVVLIVQIGLGISNVVLSLPLHVAVTHNAVGAVLLLTLVTINHRIRNV